MSYYNYIYTQHYLEPTLAVKCTLVSHTRDSGETLDTRDSGDTLDTEEEEEGEAGGGDIYCYQVF